MNARTPLAGFVLAGALCSLVVTGCKKHELPTDLIGSYSQSGASADLRAELSVSRGGMVLTVVKLSASMDMGAFSTLFTGQRSATAASGGSVDAAADIGRSVALARTFKSLACDKTSCEFELAAEGGQEDCAGSFEKVANTLIVIAGGACKMYSGRWVVLEGLPPELAASGTAPAPPSSSTPPVAPAGGAADAGAVDGGPAKLEFPPDIPAPHDHMSCLQACSILDTRCHRTVGAGDRNAFLGCVEKGQICRARCEQVFPFFEH